MRKVVILTALSVERKAVRAYLSERDEIVHPTNGTIYDEGIFTSSKGSWKVLVVETGMGNVAAAVIAQQAIDFLSPEMVFFVGVAGGLKDVEPGDVVASTKIYQYASGKEDGKHFYPRAEVGVASFRLTQRARAVILDDEWQERVRGMVSNAPPRAFVGPIAAGERVVASDASPTAQFLKQQYSDALAVEMEGYGALSVAHTNRHIEAIVIRGISDTLSDKTALDRQNYQDIAARHASAFAFEMLAKMATSDPDILSTKTEIPPAQIQHPNNENIAEQQSGAVQAQQISPLKIFYSYADTDRELIEELKKQLIMLHRTGRIQEWDHNHLLAGETRRERIDWHIQRDDFFIIGISSTYLASDECYDEMEEILRQRARRDAKVLPILLRKTAGIRELPIGKLTMYPLNGKPVNENRASAIEEIASKIIQEVTGRSSRNS